jgi:hypothetical protein
MYYIITVYENLKRKRSFTILKTDDQNYVFYNLFITTMNFGPLVDRSPQNPRTCKATIRAQSRQSAKLFLQSSELGLPRPLPRRRVCPLPPVLGGGAYSLAREGLGESQLRRGDIHCGTLYIYVLCAYGYNIFIARKACKIF